MKSTFEVDWDIWAWVYGAALVLGSSLLAVGYPIGGLLIFGAIGSFIVIKAIECLFYGA